MMSGLPYSNSVVNYYDPRNQFGQYGVDMNLVPSTPSSGSDIQGSGIVSSLPFIGGMLGAVGNIASQAFQNSTQERFYNDYMSPQARMAQMRAAGINPNAAAQGISGSSAPSMVASAPNSAFSDIGRQLGESVNTSLTAQNIVADTREKEAASEDYKSSAKLKDSQNVGQQIENANKQDWYDKVLREMDNKNLIDKTEYRILSNDAALSDALYTGKIYQFWIGLAQQCQDLINAEEEHNLIIASIKEKYSNIALNAELAETEDAKQLNIRKDTELKEEDRRYKAFRRNMISTFHYDPDSPVESNIAFAMAVGDTEAATYWAHTLGRFQAEANGWSEEQKGVFSQQFEGYKGLFDIAKFMIGGSTAAGINSGNAASAGKEAGKEAAEKTLESWRQGGHGN